MTEPTGKGAALVKAALEAEATLEAEQRLEEAMVRQLEAVGRLGAGVWDPAEVAAWRRAARQVLHARFGASAREEP